MQTLQQQQAFKIEETERKDSLLEILSDKYCRSILESIMYKPKSVIEITSDTNIPMSTVYRRVQNLHDNKLLHISGVITDEGKRLQPYTLFVPKPMLPLGDRPLLEHTINYKKTKKTA